MKDQEIAQTIRVTAEHQIPLAREAVLGLARAIGFPRVTAYYAATAVSELAANLVFHATHGGAITVRTLASDGRLGIEILAEDSGPGIPDISQALQDGFSTRGSLGGGLPGVKRLMDGLEISSAPGQGTRIRTWKWQPCKSR